MNSFLFLFIVGFTVSLARGQEVNWGKICAKEKGVEGVLVNALSALPVIVNVEDHQTSMLVSRECTKAEGDIRPTLNQLQAKIEDGSLSHDNIHLYKLIISDRCNSLYETVKGLIVDLTPRRQSCCLAILSNVMDETVRNYEVIYEELQPVVTEHPTPTTLPTTETETIPTTETTPTTTTAQTTETYLTEDTTPETELTEDTTPITPPTVNASKYLSPVLGMFY